MNDEKNNKRTFLETTIGMIAGVTALIAAITGLIAVLNSSGCFGPVKNDSQNSIVSLPDSNDSARFSYKVSFFEGDKVPTPGSRSEKKFTFSRDAKYIYAELEVFASQLPVENVDFSFHFRFYDSSGKLVVYSVKYPIS